MIISDWTLLVCDVMLQLGWGMNGYVMMSKDSTVTTSVALQLEQAIQLSKMTRKLLVWLCTIFM